MERDLSVIIPAKEEIYLERTVRNVLSNIRGNTEIIVVLDNYIPVPQIHFNDDRVRVAYFDHDIGQRKAINEGVKLSSAKFIMKLDAHCAVDEGFDVKLMADCEPSWTVVPRMYNLDVESWKPRNIDNPELAMRLSKLHDYMFMGWKDNELRALYYTGRENKVQHAKTALIDDTMCCMGPGWFMHRDRFWEQEGCDEGHEGGWGQQGVEVSCKAWLSGGALKVNKKTWFAHWFRGGGGPGFPYPISGGIIDRVRAYSKDLWINNKWGKATRKFQWMVDKFTPPTWTNSDLTILFYTANLVSDKIMEPVVRSLKRHTYPIISVSQKPMNLGNNIVVPQERSLQNIYKQVLVGAKRATTKYVALCEDDCIYLPEHFKYRPSAPFGYNLNRWLFHVKDCIFTYRERCILSQCIADREALIKTLEERIKLPSIQDKHCGEPGVFDEKLGVTVNEYETFRTPQPNLVICHGKNITGIKLWGKDADPRKTLEPWGEASYWSKKLGGSMKFGRGAKAKARKQWGHIGSVIMSMDEMMKNIIDYRDRRRPIERAVRRTETMTPFIKRILADEEFTDEQLMEMPYYTFLGECGNGKTKSLSLMRDLINLARDVRLNGVKNPVDMWRVGDALVIHRGWRRILIMNELGYKTVACRVFKTRELFLAHMPSKDIVEDNSIHGIAQNQFVKLHEKATDKYWVHSYTKLYDRHIGYLRPTAKKILEIGVFRGASLLLWKHSFPKAQIFGVEKRTEIWQKFLAKQERAKVFVGRQEDVDFLKRDVVPSGPYDIIVDDGMHHPEETKVPFKTLWGSVKPGGWYVIEDLYGQYKWGKSNTINLLKDMIDDMNKRGEIRSMHFYYNICFIQKA